jgi:hypothetical protein
MTTLFPEISKVIKKNSKNINKTNKLHVKVSFIEQQSLTTN